MEYISAGMRKEMNLRVITQKNEYSLLYFMKKVIITTKMSIIINLVGCFVCNFFKNNTHNRFERCTLLIRY
jgi:hypothetical protein